MKNKVRKYYALAGGLSYLIATLLKNVLLKDFISGNDILGLAIFITTFTIIFYITNLSIKLKYPEDFSDLEKNSKDERGLKIRGKSAEYTLIFIFFLAIITLVVPETYISDYKYVFSNIFVITYLFYFVTNIILNKIN